MRRGENCHCGRWNPSFATDCHSCHRSLRLVLVARMASYFDHSRQNQGTKKEPPNAPSRVPDRKL